MELCGKGNRFFLFLLTGTRGGKLEIASRSAYEGKKTSTADIPEMVASHGDSGCLQQYVQ